MRLAKKPWRTATNAIVQSGLPKTICFASVSPGASRAAFERTHLGTDSPPVEAGVGWVARPAVDARLDELVSGSLAVGETASASQPAEATLERQSALTGVRSCCSR